MTNQQLPPNEQSVNFLKDECDRLLSLYNEAQSNIQSVFNFYLTFLTTVTGGVVLIVQIGGGQPARTQLMVIALLFFAAIVGSVYLSAIAFRYARAKRYAEAVDQIRAYLMQGQNLTLPAMYDALQTVQFERQIGRGMWLFPTGTYQMFIAFVNSAALGIIAVLIGISGAQNFGVSIFAALLIFVVTQIVYNVYAQLILYRFGHGITVSNPSSSMWAGRN
jgi:hypothetical protein